jgi:lipopolysaccharide/colanic/teichoic acid biosynthesis glycosyltransferase
MCCLAALPCLGLLTLSFGLIALAADRGPVFFRQEMVGYGGQRLRLFRFRTMRMKSGARMPREGSVLIPGGRFLRASGLAELPQIVNVLRGEMSIVGPRPVHEYDANQAAPELSAVPGLTGWWRVSHPGRVNADQVAQWDAVYPQRKTLWLDSRIILQTIPVVCVNALGFRNSDAMANRLPRDATRESGSLGTPSQRPW